MTVARTETKRPEIYKFLRDQIAAGRQIYIVYPLVEESEAMDLKKEKNFFETRVIEYQNGGALNWE